MRRFCDLRGWVAAEFLCFGRLQVFLFLLAGSCGYAESDRRHRMAFRVDLQRSRTGLAPLRSRRHTRRKNICCKQQGTVLKDYQVAETYSIDPYNKALQVPREVKLRSRRGKTEGTVETFSKRTTSCSKERAWALATRQSFVWHAHKETYYRRSAFTNGSTCNYLLWIRPVSFVWTQETLLVWKEQLLNLRRRLPVWSGKLDNQRGMAINAKEFCGCCPTRWIFRCRLNHSMDLHSWLRRRWRN